ncbi:hypothetical protein [Labrys monachus]|uniref:Uncharacterized protein n=1 Tax=Labrys monachus TaxID=217067 RepID=A0ABU0FEM3_9HYPH|nr:hypothetical protein [Labrys monachus]MDQ0392896.1 hypothetical protein [Labrys monachus]
MTLILVATLLAATAFAFFDLSAWWAQTVVLGDGNLVIAGSAIASIALLAVAFELFATFHARRSTR